MATKAEVMRSAAMVQAQGLRFKQLAIARAEFGDMVLGLTEDGRVFERFNVGLWDEKGAPRQYFTFWKEVPTSTDMVQDMEDPALPKGWNK